MVGHSLAFGYLANPFARGVLITIIKTVGRLHLVERGESVLADVLVEFRLEFERKAVVSDWNEYQGAHLIYLSWPQQHYRSIA